jgi:putative spermidine/putrescine transport system ATP-binding protein
MNTINGNAQGVVLEDVTVHYGKVTALDGVSLQVNPGELISLLGPSGCGKTTLLRVIGGFVSLDRGEVHIGGVACTNFSPSKRNLGMVFQDYALFPHMTVARNIAFGLKMRSIPLQEQDLLVKDVLNMLSLEGLGDRYPRQLSGGQQQRVALARALVVKPGVLLLDEPLGALDKKLREEMQIELRSLQKRLGITTIFVTHDQDEALSLSDRVVVLEKGRIAHLGTPREVYEYPKTQFSGLFVGKSNLFEGETVYCHNNEAVCAVYGIGKITLKKSAKPGEKSRAILRPEKVQLSNEKPLDADKNCVFGVIEHSVYLGMITEYHLRTEKGVRVIATLLNTGTSSRIFAIGDSIWATWSAEDLINIP